MRDAVLFEAKILSLTQNAAGPEENPAARQPSESVTSIYRPSERRQGL